MKKKLWIWGLGLTMLLCGLQFLFGSSPADGKKSFSKESFTIESEASMPAPAKKYSLKKKVYYFSTVKKRYVLDQDATSLSFSWGGHTVDLSREPREGYVLSEVYINGESVPVDTSQYVIMGNTEVVYYYMVLPLCRQTYRYYRYNPSKGAYELDRTTGEVVSGGIYYTTKISFEEEKYHVQEIYHNSEKITPLENFTYVTTGNSEIDVYLYPNRTMIEYYDEAQNRLGTQTFLYGEKKKLLDCSLKKTGYEFAGWRGTVKGENRLFQAQEEFTTPYTEDMATIRLVAEFKPMEYRVMLKYHSQSSGQGTVYSAGQHLWSDVFTIWKQGDLPEPVKDATLLGWSLKPEQNTVQYRQGQELSTKTLYLGAKSYSLVNPEEKDAVIELYPLWDRAPVVKTSHIYISGKDAESGKITKQYLYRQLEAVDPEEGTLALLTEEEDEMPGVSFPDYQESDFTAGKAGSFSLTVMARDSGGNEVTSRMICTIVESDGAYLGKVKKVRFISKEYLDTLSEDSVWRTNEQYHTLLEKVLEKAS